MLPAIPTHTYNLFRIPSSSTQALKNTLVSKNLHLTKTKVIDGYAFSFYFSEIEPDSPVKWLELYRDFLPDDDLKFNRIYSAVLVIETNKTHDYSISLGGAHFYVSRFADPEFGLDLAERIATKDIKEKDTKHFFSNKDQSFIKFRDDNDIDDSESGEYYQHIKCTTAFTSGWNWGKYASFGTSVILKLPLQPNELSTLIKKVELELKKPIRIKIPRVKKIKDQNEIDRLETLFLNALADDTTGAFYKNIIISNKDFWIDATTDYHIYLSGKIDDKEKLSDFNIECIRDYCKQKNIDLSTQIDELKVLIDSDTLHPIHTRVRNYIDFISDDYECLIKGKWHKFNQSYLGYLDRLIDEVERIPHNPKHDIDNTEYNKYLDANKKSYVEKYFNELRGLEGYDNEDRTTVKIEKRYSVELLDLHKNKCIYFVKVGIPQKLTYAIDQAMNTLNLLKNNKAKVIINGRSSKPSKICLWLILERKTTLKKISELDSIIFKWKLVEWIRLSKSLKIEPVISINYRK